MKIPTGLSVYVSPRYIFGLILIISSFASAFVISRAADRTYLVWSASVDLAPGEVLTQEDLLAVRVRLPDNAEQYLDATRDITGASVLRSIGAAELIPSFALSSKVIQKLKVVPVSIPREWAPVELQSGSIVDVYAIPNQTSAQFSQERIRTRLLLAEISIDNVDLSSRDLGGRIGISLLVPEAEVAKLVSVMSDHQFLLVRSAT